MRQMLRRRAEIDLLVRLFMIIKKLEVTLNGIGN